MTNEHKEKRNSPRVTIPGALVRYKILDSIHKSMYLEESPQPVRNISTGGLSFNSDAALAVHSHLRIDLQITPEQEPVRAFGKVSWIRKDEQTRSYQLGIGISWWQQGDDGKRILEQALAGQAA